MQIPAFSLTRLPRIIFGEGEIRQVPNLAKQYGKRALIVTGLKSFRLSSRYEELLAGFLANGIGAETLTVSGEPSPEVVDEAVSKLYGQGIDIVVAVGGGSVIDAAKAIAGLLPYGNSVMDHLEGVGLNVPYNGPSIPLIAVPTTAGAGSEATKNSVLSIKGQFKKSFRHECLVAEYAVVDPTLLATCPPELIAADGMDTFTQLLESYLSLKSNRFTDALALSGIEAFRDGFFPMWEGGSSEAAQAGRSAMAYAALISGITLAQVGLGAVHGLAAPLGAFFPVPHGMVCGTLLAETTATNIKALFERGSNQVALMKYGKASSLLAQRDFQDLRSACETLVQLLRDWTESLHLQRLGAYGVSEIDLPRIVSNARGNSMLTNPILLTDQEIEEIVRARI